MRVFRPRVTFSGGLQWSVSRLLSLKLAWRLPCCRQPETQKRQQRRWRHGKKVKCSSLVGDTGASDDLGVLEEVQLGLVA